MEPDDDFEAAGTPSAELDISSVRRSESPDDREPQAESFASFVRLPEAVERPAPLGLAQSGTFVGDA